IDRDGDPLTYTVTIMAAGSDPSWNGLSVSGTHIVGVPTVAPGNPFLTILAQSSVKIEVTDGRGGFNETSIAINILPNASPTIVQRNEDHVLGVGAPVDMEVTGNGTVFKDADGDPLTYQVTLGPQALGLRVEGTRVVGTLSSFGAVFVHVRADDGFGGS